MSNSMNFNVEFTTRAIKDLKKLPKNIQKQILKESIRLETEPFQFKNKKKRLKDFIFPVIVYELILKRIPIVCFMELIMILYMF